MITIVHDLLRRPRGRVTFYAHEAREAARPEAWEAGAAAPPPLNLRRRLLFERDNIFVNTGLTMVAGLLGQGYTPYIAAAVGFGSGNTLPAVGDVDLALGPKYYNAVGTHIIGPSGAVAAGSVLFNYTLATTDYAANPLTIQELGLFGSVTGVLPALVGGTFSAWASAHAYVVGNLLLDANGNTQRCTSAGTSGGAAPTWSTAMAGTTTDNTVTWTVVALHTPPTPMIAHVVVPAFPYVGAGNYSGTWTIAM